MRRISDAVLDRAAGCLAGQFCGDAFGAQYEFMSPEQISEVMNGDCSMRPSSVWGTAAGQITDDSEMAVVLAKSLIEGFGYSALLTVNGYIDWLNSRPFDIGGTVHKALSSRGLNKNVQSKANGALMRVSPIGVCYAHDYVTAGNVAIMDAELTHPNNVCRMANMALARGIAYAIKTGGAPEAICGHMMDCHTAGMCDEPDVLDAIKNGMVSPPDSTMLQHSGYVLLALQNAVYRLTHADSASSAIIDTVRMGGDTDTNAAIAGALVGAYRGFASFPTPWIKAVQECDTAAGLHPRREYQDWARDIVGLAKKLLLSTAA
ncbi:MAG: ADP-ribosylglycohydrolase family protein [Synergistaceae bacterium]|nr:ADP-ribosylglycohydrolase family protein [Synergistaceae bacterium]